jgi:hypothetical protein
VVDPAVDVGPGREIEADGDEHAQTYQATLDV